VIADQSVNHVERFIIAEGHTSEPRDRKMRAPSDFALSRYAVWPRGNACADARSHLPLAYEFSLIVKKSQKTQGFCRSNSFGKNLRTTDFAIHGINGL